MPPSKQAQTPRKKPQQARSKSTVEAILDGAVRVLDQEGAEALTTTRVAEVAGVSVGTLYQYFAHRAAIVDALQDREFLRATEMLGAELGQTTEMSERQLARAIVGGLLHLYRNAPGLHRLLAVEGLHVTPTERVQAFDHKIVSTLRFFFESTSLKVERANKHAAAFVLYQSVRATLLAAILEEPVGITDAILVDEVSDMVSAHLSISGLG